MNKFKEKDMLFRFLESIYEKQMNNSSIDKIEKKLFDKLHSVNKEIHIKNSDFENITDLIYELCSEIKYSYFVCGVLAGNAIEEFSG